MAHLLAKDLGRFKRVSHTRDEVTNHRVAALASAGLRDSVSVDLQSFSVKLRAPVIALIEESLILLLQMPQFVSLVRFKAGVKLTLPTVEASLPEERLQLLAIISASLIQDDV